MYGLGTSAKRASACTNFQKRGDPWNIPSRVVDGMDVFAVKEAGLWAVEHARSGQGPVLLHIKTYRYRGHSMSDPAKYRSKEEVEEMRKNHDPIDRIRILLEKEYGVGEDELKALEKSIKEIVNESARFAEESPEPEASELYTDVLL
jgi:pyruvate dehydrogenase E1 component alpha subunit